MEEAQRESLTPITPTSAAPPNPALGARQQNRVYDLLVRYLLHLRAMFVRDKPAKSV